MDFLAVRDFSVLNLADWAIVGGGVLIVYCSFRGRELGGSGGTTGEVSAGTARP